MKAGLLEPRIFQLKKVTEEKELIGIIALAIKSFDDFLGSKPMTGLQILDAAELITKKFDSLSVMAIVDCFERVKSAEPPFDDVIYRSLDGRKIMELLRKYDKVVEAKLFRDETEQRLAENFSRHLSGEGKQQKVNTFFKQLKKQKK